MKKYSTKNSGKQDGAKLKAFRHDVAVLKKKGLLDKSYDARSVTPTKYLKSQVKKFGAVLSGEAQTVKVSKAKAAHYKAQGYQVKAGRVVVPVHANETVYGTHGDFRVKTTGKHGSITRIDLGLSKNNIHQWRDELLKRRIKLGEGERITFQIFGNNSYRSFKNFSQLLEYLEYYGAYEKAEESGDPNIEQEFIENVVIYKIARDSVMPPPERNLEWEAARKARATLRRQRWLDRMSPEQQQRTMAYRAEAEKARREKMSEQKKEEYRERARERARKSYAERSGKK